MLEFRNYSGFTGASNVYISLKYNHARMTLFWKYKKDIQVRYIQDYIYFKLYKLLYRFNRVLMIFLHFDYLEEINKVCLMSEIALTHFFSPGLYEQLDTSC